MEATPRPLMFTETGSGLSQLLMQKRQQIDKECERFVRIGDTEALHDLRVAMRRLHSLFIAFAPAIDPSSRLPGELRLLFKNTNHARDLEVTLAILYGTQQRLPWLEKPWQKELEQEYQHLRQSLPAAWQTLSPALDTPQQLLKPDQTLQQSPLGHFAAKLLRIKVKRMEKRCNDTCQEWHDRPAHKLRIIAKQIRYIIEPFAEESTACQKAVARLKIFQDLMGEHHDIVVLHEKLKQLQTGSEPAQRIQLKQLRKHLKNRLTSLQKTFYKNYCNNNTKRLHAPMKKARKALAKS